MSYSKRDEGTSVLVGDVLEFDWRVEREEAKDKTEETGKMSPSGPDAIPTNFTLTLNAMGSKEVDSSFNK